MKIALSLFTAAAIYLLQACNGSQTSSQGTDTTTTASADTSAPIQSSAAADTARQGDALMQPMHAMMSKMQSMQMSGDFDKDFATMLIEHHQGAVDMAQIELAKGSDEKLKTMAQNIITKQTKEQGELKTLLQNYKASGMKHGEGELQKSMSTSMDKMQSMQMSGNIDKDFASMMASHHQDGISMAQLELKNGMDAKLKQIAQKGIEDQQKEIKEFNAWVAAH